MELGAQPLAIGAQVLPASVRSTSTRLGTAIRARRGDRAAELAVEIGVARSTISGLERGTHKPSAETARALARWLGWTTDQVLDAAAEPVPPPGE